MQETSAHLKASPNIPTPDIKTESRTSPPQFQKLSPKAKPSPLRAMFFPLHEENIYHDTHKDNLGISSPSSLNNGDTENTYEAKISPIKPLSVKRARSKESHLVDKNRNVDSDLYGLIQELVYEAKAWDESLFVDNKFKAMIDGSSHALVNAPLTTRKKRPRGFYRPQQPLYTVLEDILEIEGTYARLIFHALDLTVIYCNS